MLQVVVDNSDFDNLRTIFIDKGKGIKAEVGIIGKKTKIKSFVFPEQSGWCVATMKAWVDSNSTKISHFDLEDDIDAKALELLSNSEEYDLKTILIGKKYGEFSIKKTDDESRDGIRISGLASTFGNIDRHGDIIAKGAFKKTIRGLGKLPMLMDHSHETNSQAGSFDKFKETDEGLVVSGFLSRTQQTEHVIRLIEDGHLDTLSIGGLFKFAVEPNKKGNSIIEEVNLFEVSIVTIPANPKAQFGLKSLMLPGKPEILVDKSTNSKGLSPEEKAEWIKKEIREGK